jgi:hypothetical protein
MFQKIGLVSVLTFFMISIHAQHNSLVIFSANGNPFYLTVNGESINKTAQSNLKIFDMSTGWNFIEIKIPSIIKELTFKDSILLKSNTKFSNKEFTYSLIEKDGKLQLKFQSVSELSGPEIPTVPVAPKEVIPLVDNNLYGHLYRAKINTPFFFNHYKAIISTCDTVLSDVDLKYAVNLLNKCNDEETQSRYLTQIIENNCLTISQLNQLLTLIPIDMDRLTLAKVAYPHIIDKENSKSILAVLKYPTMKESYTDFIKEQENKAKQKSLKCSEPLADDKFNDLLSKLKNTPYENDKYKLAKRLIVDVCLSTQQVKQITPNFSHDREKLDFLLSAYNVLTDKENAKLLVSEFQSSQAQEEYLELISKQ